MLLASDVFELSSNVQFLIVSFLFSNIHPGENLGFLPNNFAPERKKQSV
ncbi:hypothetical protein [Spiroplasma endosymbiont of Nebria brevicollis]